MPRQTISLSEPNHEWIQQKIDSREFRNQTDVVNDALRRVRELESGIETIRARLIAAEASGFTEDSLDDIWNDARSDPTISSQ